MTANAHTRLLHVLPAGLLASCVVMLTACASLAADGSKQLTAAEQAAVDVAMRALPAEARASGEPRVQSIEPRRWPDSSLGCPQRGMSYLQVITEGYAVRLESAGEVHEIRVAGDMAVTCAQTLSGVARRSGSSTRVTNLDVIEKQAVGDLAQRLHVAPGEIRVASRTPQRWQDSSLDCSGSPAARNTQGEVAGYKLMLRHAGRLYSYHTDLKQVMACPPIEAD